MDTIFIEEKISEPPEKKYVTNETGVKFTGRFCNWKNLAKIGIDCRT